MSHTIFLDDASTTKCRKSILEEITRIESTLFANSASSHPFGYEAYAFLEKARKFFANWFQIEPRQVLFTSGGTEANNLVIQGTCLASFLKNKSSASPQSSIWISAGEHASVSKVAQALQDYGFSLERIPLTDSGHLKLDTLPSKAPLLMSVMRVNNITGVIFPIEELAQKVKEKFPNTIIHSDCVQALGKTSLPRKGVDFLTISSHKIYGPKGVGAVIVLNPKLLHPSKLRPILFGGSHEGGFRAGTVSTSLIFGFYLAAKALLEEEKGIHNHIEKLQKRFQSQLKAQDLLKTHKEDTAHPVYWISAPDAVPHIVCLSLPHIPIAPLVQLLESEGFMISTTSACGSKKFHREPVLEAMRLPVPFQEASMRISFSKDNQIEEVDAFVLSLKKNLDRIKKLF